MITAKGFGFLIVAISLYLLGRLTQVGWLYLIDAILWGILLVSAILPWLQVAFLNARRRLEHSGAGEGRNGPAEGESAQIELTLHNRTLWPRFFLNASYECPLADPDNRQPRFFVGKLDGLSRFPMSLEVKAYRRGMYNLGRVIIESSAPFGLFRRRIVRDELQPVLVYPQVHQLHRMNLVDSLTGESAQSQKSRLGLDIAGSRPYFSGDSIRHIHWRNTARSGRPMVKEFEEPKDQTLRLLFDATQVWGQEKETTLEYAIKVVASVADYTHRNRLSMQIWGGDLQGVRIDPNSGQGLAWPELLKRLALVAPGEGGRLSEAVDKLPPGCNALAIVSAADRQSIRAIALKAPALQRLIVVALEDFGEPQAANDALDSLELARIPLTRCRPGQLVETLISLERLGEMSRQRARAA